MDGETSVIGALADSVQEVSEFQPEHIEPPPKLGTQLNVEFIKGIGKQEEAFVIILDIDRIFSSVELQHVASAGEATVSKEEAAQAVNA